jgi:exodeoxyribonuclease VII large subunit
MSEYPLFDAQPSAERPLSVWEFTTQVKDLLESAFPEIWVAGEISNFARPQSGHCYLTLKDDRAQLRAVLWRGTAARVRFDMHDGLEVICRGHLDLYAARGTYQLVIDDILPKGMGALELALRQLREKLAREGLFDPARKRPLPPFVRQIAVVTSPTGAAIRDFLQVLARRWRGANVLIVPARVQGDGAAEEIAAGIQIVNAMNRPVDCLVVARGGGSMEDLWSFNEEVVVRAIAASRIPVISAVGHEIDVTLSDLAADVRALTPSEAAELVAPASEDLLAGLRQYERRLAVALRSRADAARSRTPFALPPSLSTAFRTIASFGRVGCTFTSGDSRRGSQRPATCGSDDATPGIAQPSRRPRPRLQFDAKDVGRQNHPRRLRIVGRRPNHHPLRPRPNHQPRGTD